MRTLKLRVSLEINCLMEAFCLAGPQFAGTLASINYARTSQNFIVNLTTGKTSQAITPFHFFDYFHSFDYFDFLDYYDILEV